jgi:hypothetical protein
MISPVQFRKLTEAVKSSYSDLDSFRKHEAEAFRQYVGQHYGENASPRPMPVNMMELGVSTLLQQLAAKEPQALLLSRNPGLQADTSEAELALCQQFLKMDFGTEQTQFVLSAIFSVGIMKVGIDAGYVGEIEGEKFTDTEVFAEAIPFSDWVHDTTAKKWRPSEVQFCGHMYRVPLKWAQQNEKFDLEARRQLGNADNHDALVDGQTDELGDMSHGHGSPIEADFVKHVDLWDIWIPSERKMITYAKDAQRPLHDRHIRRGTPYHMLGFNPVLKNIMPLSPVANWLDAHDLENELFTKLGEQASRQKTITLVAMPNKDDGEAIIDTEDGQVLAVSRPEAAKEVRFGGADNQTLGFAGYMRDMVNLIMYNVDSAAGLAPSAGTASQEKLIKASSNMRIQSMQGLVVKSLRGIIRDILGYMWENPLTQFDITQKVPGTDIEVPTTWPLQTDEFGQEVDVREGVDVNLWEVDIEPHSLQNKPPDQRLEELRQIWREDILPLAQAGLVQANPEEYLRMINKYGDFPEIEKLAMQMPEMMQQFAPDENRAPRTQHESVRTNINAGPGMSARGAERSMVANAMAGPAPGQQAS